MKQLFRLQKYPPQSTVSLFFICIIYFRLRRSQKLRLLQVVEIFPNLTGCKQPSDCGDKRRNSAAKSESCSDAVTKVVCLEVCVN